MKKRKILVPLLSLAVLFPTATNVFADPLKPAAVKTVEFIGMEAPDTAQERAKMYSEASALVTYNDGSQKTIPLEYKSLFNLVRSSTGKSLGAAYDAYGKMITNAEGKPIYFTFT